MIRYLSEGVGTFFLALAINSGNPLTIGTIFMAMLYMTGPYTNGYLNPAVTIAMWLRGALESRYVLGYIVAQTIGACFVTLLIYVMNGKLIGSAVAAPAAGIAEFMFTFVLCAVILVLATTQKSKGQPINGMIMGFTLLGIASFNGIFNPAVILGWAIPNVFVYAVTKGTSGSINYLPMMITHVVVPCLAGALAAWKLNKFNPDKM
jgi:aquaporin Z